MSRAVSDFFTWDPTRQVWMSVDESVLIHRLVCGKWAIREGDVNIGYARTSERALEKAERWIRTRIDVANVQQV